MRESRREDDDGKPINTYSKIKATEVVEWSVRELNNCDSER